VFFNLDIPYGMLFFNPEIPLAPLKKGGTIEEGIREEGDNRRGGQ
jgi:hypothetical protein